MNFLRQWAKSKAAQALALGLASGLLVLVAQRLGAFETPERRSLDWRFRIFADPGRASRNIVIIALDDFSFDSPEMLENFGRWPWRRRLYAGLIDYVNGGGAKTVGIDLLFQGADPHSGDDAALAQVLAEKRNVILGFAFNELIYWKKDPKAEETRRRHLAPFALEVREALPLELKPYSGVDLPEEEFLRAAAGIGCFAVKTDPDGPLRSVTPLFHYGDRYYPSFPLAIVALTLGVKPEVALEPGPSLHFAGRRIPLDEHGKMLIRWHGGYKTYKHYPVWQIVNSVIAADNGQKPAIPPEAFKDKIVLIGSTATGTNEIYTNPFSESYPGVEMHATVIDDLLQGDFVRAADRRLAPMAVLTMALLVVALVYAFNSAPVYTLLCAAAGSGYAVGVCWLFRAHHLWAPMMAPLSAGTIGFLGANLTRYVTEGREKRKYRKTLLRYLSPQLVETIMEDFNWASLRAEKRTLTVLFSDVRGFTTFSEKYPPETVIATLNEHLNMMVSVIFKYQGTLDKFVGDCVMAFWGAPLVQPNHVELACRAALEMIEGLENLNRKWQSEGRPTLKIGVGINTGEMLFGNIGSEQRMDFTVIGDSVNLGSRLESSTKELKASIVISDASYQQVRNVVEVRPLGEIHVKGKEKGILVYELLGMAGVVSVKEAAS